jgi:heat-inducible transcriptional repressor
VIDLQNDLSERQQVVLAAIVREYDELKSPIGSDALVRKYLPGVSAATVRNDMMTLAASGYICSTHPSSGRIPTQLGYRYYVHNLMRPAEIASAERRMIDHQFHQIESDLDQWTRLAATVLAQTTGNASFVTTPFSRPSRLRHLDLIATKNRSALVVVLLQEGTLHQQLLALAEVVDQDRLDLVSHRLGWALRGADADEVQAWVAAESPLELAVRDCVVELMRRVDRKTTREVWFDGVSSLLGEPEFARGERAQELVRSFERRQSLVEIAEAVKDREGIQVQIGDENPTPVFRDCAVVSTRYGSGNAAGVIGVVGPTRLRYERVIAILQYLGELMTRLWAELGESAAVEPVGRSDESGYTYLDVSSRSAEIVTHLRRIAAPSSSTTETTLSPIGIQTRRIIHG